MSARQSKQVQSISKQVAGLEDKMLKKLRKPKESKRELKWEKGSNWSMELKLKASETEFECKVKKAEGEKENKVKKVESDRDKWQHKAENLCWNQSQMPSTNYT